jgi:hypothetical protein
MPMNAIHIRKQLDSDTIYLPELKPFIGKTVEIVVREDVSPIANGSKDFTALVNEWKAARVNVSRVDKMVLLTPYQQIIGMGQPAVPLILKELERSPDHWFWALHAITGENPVPEDARGNLPQMAAAWLAWGRDQGYV